jgi:hypothetical protein
VQKYGVFLEKQEMKKYFFGWDDFYGFERKFLARNDFLFTTKIVVSLYIHIHIASFEIFA